MSTPDQPHTPPLTRRQLRELRNTGATPVIDTTPTPVTPPPATPLPHAAAPVVAHPAPAPDASVDLEAVPLTRRQAREQERIRTASVPVIVRDVPQAAQPAPAGVRVPVAAASVSASAQPTPAVSAAPTAVMDPAPWAARTALELPDDTAVSAEPEAADAAEPVVDAGRPVIDPSLGARLLNAPSAVENTTSSFEELLGQGTQTSGTTTAPHALILSHPASAPLVAPIDGTGEILVTGTFALPEGLGSTGHAPGTTDGREADAVLVDGELPAQSSPTPIAASAAVSTIRTDDDIVNPPAPEKGGRLMMILAITAGVLALALIGVLVLAIASGAFA